ncbi:hypothetical protein OG594_00680 [Streptomyces sp. NBC_01214]|uniref:hypothetical protein n=1 Tax=Streptomyces sp. NBC_01214 TaxID=2903777 RepID=UPI002259E34F|nr:hypothetical protein [Streptomyces sp. NBC_01214]MCX4800205.1 hypothetical protein [Streptomyces sp. NBC_01214]
MRNTRRTTLRSAVVVAGAATVLALPIGSAFADSPAVPGPEALPGIGQPSVEPAASVRAHVTTVELADGSVAKVYKIGDSHFEADVFAGATKLDTLVSRAGAASYGQNDGLHVVLRPNGTVTSWMAGAPKPQIRKERSVRIAMPDGRIAELVDGPHGKRVEISTPKGRALATVDLRRPSVHRDDWTYRVVQDSERVKFLVIDGKGGGNGWVYDFNGRLIAKYTVDPTVASGGGGTAAAGAAGAAGLGFAVPRGQG